MATAKAMRTQTSQQARAHEALAAWKKARDLRSAAAEMEEDIENMRWCVGDVAALRGMDDDKVLDGIELIAGMEERQARMRREAYALEQKAAALTASVSAGRGA